MLLQKREENSISLAATADKGKLIDGPALGGKVSPKSSMILMAALIIALALPALIIFLLEFFRYKIEGHEDVAKLTTLPIIADVAVSTESAKTKGEIVIHENRNNQMEEIFRSMRTNLQFVLENDEKVVMFTSSTSAEGKTFITSNLAVSFALLGKKVLLVGLDIRKPRLADLFEIDDHQHGITNLLVKNAPSWEEIQQQLVPSGINNNLTLLMAGPTPPNPSELVSRKSLDDIFAELRKHYDYILVDTAPVGLVTDTIEIGRVCDATVFVCRADSTLSTTRRSCRRSTSSSTASICRRRSTATTMAMDDMASTDVMPATPTTVSMAIMATMEIMVTTATMVVTATTQAVTTLTRTTRP